MSKKKGLVQGVVAGILVLLCFLFFQFIVPSHLFLKEQVASLPFLFGSIAGYLDKPAWLACFLGDYLSALFIPMGGGALLITLILIIEWYAFALILKRFHVGEMRWIFALFPVVLEWGTYCSPIYHLCSILSLIITLFVVQGYTLIRNRTVAMIVGFLMLLVVYSLAGSRLFILVIPVLLYEAEIGEKRWIYWTLLLLAGIVVPGIMKSVYSISEEVAYQYPHRGLSAFFPAILFCFELYAVQFKTIRNMRVSVWSVTISAVLLLLLLSVAVISHVGF